MKRKTIAFIINEIDGPYFQLLIKGVIHAADKNDVNLIIIPGKILGSPRNYESNFNVVYEYINKNTVDALIVSSGTLCKYVSEKELEIFFRKFKGLPTVSISLPLGSSVLIDNTTGMKQAISHLIKRHNKKRIAFIYGAENHSESQERYNVYLDTLKENGIQYSPDLLIKGNFTYEDSYTAVNRFLNKNIPFDAIVSSNDEMAFAALNVLSERGIKVPETISITGFDNVEESILAYPMLTTVKQPVFELGLTAVDQVIKLLNNRNNVENVVLNTELVVRESCGCIIKDLRDPNFDKTKYKFDLNRFITNMRYFILKDLPTTSYLNLEPLIDILTTCVKQIYNGFKCSESDYESFRQFLNNDRFTSELFVIMHKDIAKFREVLLELSQGRMVSLIEDCYYNLSIILMEYAYRINSKRNKTYLESSSNLRDVLLTMLASMHDCNEQMQQLSLKLVNMGIKNTYIYLYDREILFNRHEKYFKKPQILNFTTSFSGLGMNESYISCDKIFSDKILPKTRFNMLMYPLFFHNEHLGLVLFEYDENAFYDHSIFESLVVEISSAIKISILLKARNQIENKLKMALKELEEYNDKLNYISLTDELTGLYNRRGFLNLAQKSLELSQKRHQSGYFFYADMDRLKKINDTYGHEEGDIAIKMMSDILRETFRSSDILARLGGDEFTIFAVGELNIAKINARLKDLVDKYNNKSNKPYTVSISIGSVHFDYDPDLTIDKLMALADNLLYKEKRIKKQNKNKS